MEGGAHHWFGGEMAGGEDQRLLQRTRDDGAGEPSTSTRSMDGGHIIEGRDLDDGKLLRRESPVWGVTLNSIVYMFAGMSLPATMASSGFVAGTFMLVYSFVSTYSSGELLGRLCQRHPDADSYPKLLGLAVRKGASRMSSRDAAKWSDVAVVACFALQFLAYYFDTIAQLLYVSQYFDQLVPDTTRVCLWLWLVITFFLSAPLCLVPGFSESRWIAIPSFAGILVMVLIFVAEIGVTRPWDCLPGATYTKPTFYSVFLSLSAFAYCFGGHGMFPEMIREMRRPQDFSLVLKLTYAFVGVTYAICAYLGYWAYGEAVQANINLSWPANPMNVVSISIQLAVCYYCVYLTNAVLVLNIEQGLLGDELRDGGTKAETSTFPRPRRFAFRVTFLALQTAVGLILISGSGDVILGLQSLSGAVGMTALTYFLPFVMYWLVFPEEMDARKKFWFALNVALGVVIMIGGILSSAADLLENAGGVFGGYCHLTYRYSPSSPDDPCHISGYNRTHLF